ATPGLSNASSPRTQTMLRRPGAGRGPVPLVAKSRLTPDAETWVSKAPVWGARYHKEAWQGELRRGAQRASGITLQGLGTQALDRAELQAPVTLQKALGPGLRRGDGPILQHGFDQR